MLELSTETKMIIASNLTIAATIRDAAMAMKSGPQPTDSRDMVTQMFSTILSNLEKQAKDFDDQGQTLINTNKI